MKLTQKQKHALTECVRDSAAWRGALCPEDFAEFQEYIRTACDALRALGIRAPRISWLAGKGAYT